MTRKRIERAECHCEFDVYQTGSVLQGTVETGVKEFRTHLIIDSPEPDADIERIIRLAKRGCFAEQLVVNSVPLRSSYTVNGAPHEVDLA